MLKTMNPLLITVILLLSPPLVKGESSTFQLETLIQEAVNNLNEISKVDFLPTEDQNRFLKAKLATSGALLLIKSSIRTYPGVFESRDNGDAANDASAGQGAEADALKSCAGSGAHSCRIVPGTTKYFKEVRGEQVVDTSWVMTGVVHRDDPPPPVHYKTVRYTVSVGVSTAEGICDNCK